ncbi:MAG: hypothetical protein M3258_09200 [Thermoproteota archaeon]|nr:hypothetical protein [Thermoproteota archaeon]
MVHSPNTLSSAVRTVIHLIIEELACWLSKEELVLLVVTGLVKAIERILPMKKTNEMAISSKITRRELLLAVFIILQ